MQQCLGMEDKQNKFCHSHKNQKCKFLFLQEGIEEDNEIKFLCIKCIVLGEFSKGFLIDIDQIINPTSGNEIILNWPPIEEKQLYQQLDNIINEENNQQSLIQEIEQQYNQTKLYFNEKIDEYYKYILNKINQYTQNYVQSAYNQMCAVEKLKEIFTDNNQVNEEKLRELVSLQFENQESNMNLLNLVIEQYNLTQNSRIIFEHLQKKLNILFEKMDGIFKKDQIFINLVEEKNQEKIEKIAFVNEANQKLKSLSYNIQFEWQSFEEIQNGIQIDFNSKSKDRHIFFTKGCSPFDREELENSQSNYNWWVKLSDTFLSSKARSVSLFYNKKAKNYYQIDNQKGSNKIFYNDSNVELIDKAQQLAYQLQRKVNEINNKYEINIDE